MDLGICNSNKSYSERSIFYNTDKAFDKIFYFFFFFKDYILITEVSKFLNAILVEWKHQYHNNNF